jgi:predicted AAA+ superfamily ATPase/predicted nucleotidyltransferase
VAEGRGGYRSRLTEKLAGSLFGDIPQGTPRRVYGPVAMPGMATAVVGMRRSGKTMFLHQIRRERVVAGMGRERVPFVCFEDEQLAGVGADELGVLIEEYYRWYPALRQQETVVFCLDEIHVVPGWERFVRRVLDSEKVEVFLSGSSAALLSREVSTEMHGRTWEVVIHPFGFEEVLRHEGFPIPERPDVLSAPERSAVEHAFLDYLAAGGFPEAQGLEPAVRLKLLSDCVDVAILRDVLERHAVSQVVGLRWMVRQLLGNAAGKFSVEKLYAAMRSQGLSISKDTVHELLGYLEDCSLVRTLWIEAESERKRMVNPRRAYPVDPGLIPLFDRIGQPNASQALETAVLIELERRGAAVTYVRTPEDHEVDFLARSATGEMELVQVSADPTDTERELRALDEAARVCPEAGRRLLTPTSDAVPTEVPAGIIVQPAYEWMLEAPSPARRAGRKRATVSLDDAREWEPKTAMDHRLPVPDEVLARVCARHRIRRLSLFGSVLKGSARPDSDVDLLVEFEPDATPTLLDMAAIEDELSSLLDGRRVDLRTAQELSRYFREDVVREAEPKFVAE